METRISHLADYATSRDYKLLSELAMTSSVICILGTDVARTFYRKNKYGEWFGIGCRDVCYVDAVGVDELIQQCVENQVQFLMPPI